jgi:hypothetical protein
LIGTGYERSEFLDEFQDVPHRIPPLSDEWLISDDVDSTHPSQRELFHVDPITSNQMTSSVTPFTPPQNMFPHVETPRNEPPVVHTPGNVRVRGRSETLQETDPWNTPPSVIVSPERRPSSVPSPEMVLRRGNRVCSQNPKFFDQDKWVSCQTGIACWTKQQVPSSLFNAIFLQTMVWDKPWTDIQSNNLCSFLGVIDCYVDYDNNTVETWYPTAYLQMRANANNNPTWEDAMNGPNQSG